MLIFWRQQWWWWSSSCSRRRGCPRRLIVVACWLCWKYPYPTHHYLQFPPTQTPPAMSPCSTSVDLSVLSRTLAASEEKFLLHASFDISSATPGLCFCLASSPLYVASRLTRPPRWRPVIPMVAPTPSTSNRRSARHQEVWAHGRKGAGVHAGALRPPRGGQASGRHHGHRGGEGWSHGYL